MTLFFKVFEIDIYQVFEQMRPAAHRQMFSLLFSHFELKSLQSTLTNEANSWVFSVSHMLYAY
jgi:hypothetical protein